MTKRVVIVTGGAGGIGSAMVRRFASTGTHVLIADLDVEAARALADELGPLTTGVFLDAREERSIQDVIDYASKTFGRIDVLCNNVAAASMGVRDTSLVDTATEVWDETFAVNVRSFFIASKLVVPWMITQGGGVIVNMSSAAALGGDVALAAYGSSKAAVVALTRYTAVQYGRAGIRCNAVCPGPITTPNLLAHAQPMLKSALGALYSPALGTPEEVAALVSYLAGDEARFVNGAVISIDGGLIAGITPWLPGNTVFTSAE